jgi:hypothetical protein
LLHRLDGHRNRRAGLCVESRAMVEKEHTKNYRAIKHKRARVDWSLLGIERISFHGALGRFFVLVFHRWGWARKTMFPVVVMARV